MIILLMWVCVSIPYVIVFEGGGDSSDIAIFIVVDLLFFIDMILTFFTTITNHTTR